LVINASWFHKEEASMTVAPFIIKTLLVSLVYRLITDRECLAVTDLPKPAIIGAL
jgi:hypothetical protein